MIKCTDYTISSIEQLTATLNETRINDFAMDDEECEIGLRCISVALRDFSGDIIAAISVFGAVWEMDDSKIFSDILPLLKSVSKKISSRLGYMELEK